MQGLIIISNKFKTFCQKMNIEQGIASSYNHQSNGQAEVCNKYLKRTMKQCIETIKDINVALLQIKSTPIRPGLPSPVTILINRQIQGIFYEVQPITILGAQ